jgi:hypothetical protein
MHFQKQEFLEKKYYEPILMIFFMTIIHLIIVGLTFSHGINPKSGIH